MRPFTLKTEIVAVDKASQSMNKINAAASKMSKNITKESDIAGFSFKRFAANIGTATKSAAVSLGNFNTRVSVISRNIKKKVDGMLGTLGKIGVGIGLVTTLGLIANANIEVDKNMQSLSAVTGVAGKEFEGYKAKVFDASKELNMFSGDMAKAFETIGSQKPELLASAEAMSLVTKSAVILSRASGEDLAASATNLTGIMNQFQLGAMESTRTIDALAAGTIAGASSIAETGEAMKNFGTVAKSSNMSLEESVAAIQLLSLYQLKGAEAGTKARGAIIKLQQAQLGYQSGVFNTNDALKEAKTKYDKLGSAIQKDAFILDTFGIENKTTGMILMNNVSRLESMTVAVSESGKAQEMATKNMNTFSQKILDIQNAFKNETTSVQANSSQMNSLKEILGSVAKNMDKIIATVIIAVKVFAIYKAITWGAIIAQKALQAIIFAQNVVLGIQAALLGSASIAMKGNTVAIWVMNAATKAMAIGNAILTTSFMGVIAATWAFTSALLANPITWVVIGIAALIAGIVLLAKNWDIVTAALGRFWNSTKEVFSKVSEAFNTFYGYLKNSPIQAFLLPLTIAIDLVKVFIDSFKNIRDAFKFGSFVDGLKAIGMGIFNFLISPIKTLLEALSNVPGVGKLAQKGLDKINAFQQEQIIKVESLKQKNVLDEIKVNQNSIDSKEPYQMFKNEISFNPNDILGAVKIEIQKNKETELLANSLDKNTKATLDELEVQKAKKDEWKGKFKTFIAKDYNAKDYNVTNELAKTSIKNEENIAKIQNEVNKETITTNEINKSNEISKINEVSRVNDITNSVANKDLKSTEINKSNEVNKSVNNVVNENNISNFKETEIAKNAIRNEENVINTQKSILKESEIVKNTTNVSNSDIEKVSDVVKQKEVSTFRNEFTTSQNRQNKKETITINIVDKTNNKFGLQIESTGVNVITTGNA